MPRALILPPLLWLLSAPSLWAREPLTFTRACERGQPYVIGAVGDVLLHTALQRQAAKDRSFESLWAPVSKYIEGVDVAYANLEGPTAHGVNPRGNDVKDPGWTYDDFVYSSWPRFNYPNTLPHDLKASGFDVVSTANNHSLDRHELGVDRTLEALTLAALPSSGTHLLNSQSKWATIVEENGLKTAWIACTFMINEGLVDNESRVLKCYDGAKANDVIVREIKASSKTVDAVIVTPHWGTEDRRMPDKRQMEFGRFMLEAGATAVIGTHPHAVQPLEKYTTRDGREGLILYSSGNFVSGQHKLISQQSSIMLFLGLTKNNRGTFINGVKVLPLRMENEVFRTRIEVHPITRRPIPGDKPHLASIIESFPTANLVYAGEEVVPNDECDQ